MISLLRSILLSCLLGVNVSVVVFQITWQAQMLWPRFLAIPFIMASLIIIAIMALPCFVMGVLAIPFVCLARLLLGKIVEEFLVVLLREPLDTWVEQWFSSKPSDRFDHPPVTVVNPTKLPSPKIHQTDDAPRSALNQSQVP